MSDDLAGFLRDELYALLSDEIRENESEGTVTRSGDRELVVTDDDGNRYLVTVAWAGLAP